MPDVVAPPEKLPIRYRDRWSMRLVEIAVANLPANGAALDVGGGFQPTMPPEWRPKGVRYVGLDPDSQLELGPYDERIRGDIEARNTALLEQFDVILSWNTFEHVHDLRAAFENIYAYLKPGGTFAAMFAGRWAAFAVAGRMLPHAVRTELLHRVLGRQREHHFPVRYDRCTYAQITKLLAGWYEPVVVPLYNGANYFGFSASAQRAYVAYENWASTRPNLATHYLVIAKRPQRTDSASDDNNERRASSAASAR